MLPKVVVSARRVSSRTFPPVPSYFGWTKNLWLKSPFMVGEHRSRTRMDAGQGESHVCEHWQDQRQAAAALYALALITNVGFWQAEPLPDDFLAYVHRSEDPVGITR